MLFSWPENTAQQIEDIASVLSFTLITVMILYIPISYFINTDLDIQQSGLLAKYGIQYNFTTQNYDELKLALEEMSGFKYKKNSDGDTLIYVQVDGRASLRKNILNKSLLQVLEKSRLGRTRNLGYEL